MKYIRSLGKRGNNNERNINDMGANQVIMSLVSGVSKVESSISDNIPLLLSIIFLSLAFILVFCGNLFNPICKYFKVGYMFFLAGLVCLIVGIAN